MQTNVQIDSKNLRNNDDNFRTRGHHITIEILIFFLSGSWTLSSLLAKSMSVKSFVPSNVVILYITW
ncbi:hypothetical protein FF38_13777 [Lucilia cuprina]|uniref:Uncharacterized protein n=1 Tax=Lucilia cuprina TaxID=7375 RepID=A0A0L0CC14_LUCCU|nr:hypothetical protein FF38_13777 [Lucilia cuprina]